MYSPDTNMQSHRNIYSPKISIITLFGDSLQSANPIVKKKKKTRHNVKAFYKQNTLLFSFQFV